MTIFSDIMTIFKGSMIISKVGLFYILTASMIISGRVPTCNSAYSWRLYSAAPQGDQITKTMT